MLYLQNSDLKISILDPGSSVDIERFGPRFCTGVYVYQVEKKGIGPVLSGPCYPDAIPPVSDGQGLPEVFQPTFLDDSIRDGDPTLIIGVGKVAYNHDIHIMREKESVVNFCDWDVEATDRSILMVTSQQFGQLSFHLIRNALLENGNLIINTTIQNSSDKSFLFRWFAHPFFQLTNQNIECTLDFRGDMTPNAGFSLSADRMIRMKADCDWKTGHYQMLENTTDEIFEAKISSMQNPTISMKGNFPLSKVALWANDRTFSIEPFYEKQVMPLEEISWQISYTF